MPAVLKTRAAPGLSRWRPHRSAGQDGVASVELALILPVLMLLVVGAVRFGIAFNAKIEMTGAAREAARYVIAHQGAANLSASALVAAQGASPGLDLTGAEVVITNTTSGSGVCSSAAPYGEIRVTISRQYPLLVSLPPLSAVNVGVTGIGSFQC